MVFDRYKFGGKTEYKNNHAGWIDRKVYIKDPTDISMVISKKYHKRPDRLAFDLYSSPSLFWFVLQYNDMLDGNTEFVEGTKIVVPTPNRFTSGTLWPIMKKL